MGCMSQAYFDRAPLPAHKPVWARGTLGFYIPIPWLMYRRGIEGPALSLMSWISAETRIAVRKNLPHIHFDCVNSYWYTYPDEEYGNVEWSNLNVNVNIGAPWSTLISTLNPISKEWKPKAMEACHGRSINVKPRSKSGPTEIITTQNVRSLWRNRRDRMEESFRQKSLKESPFQSRITWRKKRW